MADGLEHSKPGLLKQTAPGAAGGFADTLALQVLSSAAPPLRHGPGDFIAERAEEALPDRAHARIPEAAETAAAQALGVGHGLAFGALCAVFRPRGGSPLAGGLMPGAVAWAASRLGWRLALGLMRPVWEQDAPQALAPAAEHVARGVVTVAAANWLRANLSHIA